MKRWAICKLGEYEEPGILMPKVGLYTESRKTWSKSGFVWGVCRFSVGDLTAINADPDIYVLPEGALDMTIINIPSNIRTVIRQKCEAAGFVFSDVKTTWTVRQLLNYLAGQLQPGVDCTVFDVRDIA